MRNEFINTANVQRFNAICSELEDPSSRIGPSMAMVTGAPGRGKSEASKQVAVQTRAIYIPPFNHRTATMLLKDICFELRGVRPYRIEPCLTVIRDEMAKDRRLIIIDEADNLPMNLLEMLRNINELCACPILFVGEDGLKGKLAREPRLLDRVRRSMEFGAVGQQDVAFFFKLNFGLIIERDVCNAIHRYGKGTWRRVLKFAIAAEPAMQASNATDISLDLAEMVIKNLQKDEHGRKDS